MASAPRPQHVAELAHDIGEAAGNATLQVRDLLLDVQAMRLGRLPRWRSQSPGAYRMICGFHAKRSTLRE